jgi:hypothetical protein
LQFVTFLVPCIFKDQKKCKENEGFSQTSLNIKTNLNMSVQLSSKTGTWFRNSKLVTPAWVNQKCKTITESKSSVQTEFVQGKISFNLKVI